MWERYCRGVNAIVYMVDAADHDKIEVREHLIKFTRIICKGFIPYTAPGPRFKAYFSVSGIKE